VSAERLQLKLSAKLESGDADILQRSTRTIVQQVEAMKEMVDDFSEYAKTSKKQKVNIDLYALVQEVLGLYTLKSAAVVQAEQDKKRLCIDGDPVSIRQVLHNLLKNALEATDGLGHIEIDMRRAQKNNSDFIEIGFFDDGPGIKEEQIEQIFEPYVTTKARGTGLGLAIVKKIIEEHGGAIWVDTRRKQGAGFIIHLPAI
jgi:nitrogen fixation/metabolism regulation signal transduction histidine kinase